MCKQSRSQKRTRKKQDQYYVAVVSSESNFLVRSGAGGKDQDIIDIFSVLFIDRLYLPGKQIDFFLI